MLDKGVAIIGYSGHGYVVSEASLLSGINLKYYTDKNVREENPFGLTYLGFEVEQNFDGWHSNISYILGIGDNIIRQKSGNLVLEKGNALLSVIHPNASVSKYTTIGKGCFVGRNASINPLTTIGDFCILNTACIVEHECILAKGVHIAPGAVLAGNVEVGENSFVGANSVVKQGVVIGKNVIIGAGSVIIKNIPDGMKVAGNPAKTI